MMKRTRNFPGNAAGTGNGQGAARQAVAKPPAGMPAGRSVGPPSPAIGQARERLARQTFKAPVSERPDMIVAHMPESGVAVSPTHEAEPTEAAYHNGFYRRTDGLGARARATCPQIKRHVPKLFDEGHLLAAEMFRADWQAAGCPQRITVAYEPRLSAGAPSGPAPVELRLDRVQTFRRACEALGEWRGLVIAVACHDESIGAFVMRTEQMPVKKAQAAGVYGLRKSLQTLVKFYDLKKTKK